jgi:hypothetical protein
MMNVRIRITAQVTEDGGQAGWYDRTVQVADFDGMVKLGRELGDVLAKRPTIEAEEALVQ